MKCWEKKPVAKQVSKQKTNVLKRVFMFLCCVIECWFLKKRLLKKSAFIGPSILASKFFKLSQDQVTLGLLSQEKESVVKETVMHLESTVGSHDELGSLLWHWRLCVPSWVAVNHSAMVRKVTVKQPEEA